MTDTSWRVRPYRPGDERTLVKLWTDAFRRPATEAWWRWKALGRDGAVPTVGLAAATDDDRPIFQFIGIPCNALVLGSPRRVMVGADVVTAPEFRRRGVFTATVKELFATWRDAGVALVLGLANDRWGSRAAALGYERSFHLRWLIRPIRPERLLASRIGMSALARLGWAGDLWNSLWSDTSSPEIALRPLPAPTSEIDTVWEQRGPRVRTSIVRDRAWATWRYHTCPQADYRLTLAERAGRPVGYSAHRIEATGTKTVVHLAEIFTPDDDVALQALVRGIVAQARVARADRVVTLAVPGSPLYRALRRAGFLFSPGAYRLEFVRLDPALPAEQLADPSGWWLTGGDFDVI